MVPRVDLRDRCTPTNDTLSGTLDRDGAAHNGIPSQARIADSSAACHLLACSQTRPEVPIIVRRLSRALAAG